MAFDPTGDIWLADNKGVFEYSSSGGFMKELVNTSFSEVFAAVFNPPFNTIYVGDLATGNIFTYDLNGTLTNTFNPGHGGVQGLSVAGTVITPPPTLRLLNKMQVQPCGKGSCGTATITAQLYGGDGSPIANVPVKLTLHQAGFQKHKAPRPPQVPGPQQTDSSGLAHFSFTTGSPQGIEVEATASDPASGRTLTSNKASVTFSPPSTSLSPIGALVYNRGGNCSGSVIQSSSGLVVVTAAHCVTDAEAEGPGFWVFGPAYDFASSYAPYGVCTVPNYVIDRNNFPNSESYDYAFFVIERDDNGRTVQQIAGGFGGDFSAATGRGFEQYAYPAEAGPGGPAGLIQCQPKRSSTGYESSPDSNGAAQYNLVGCDNKDAFIGSSSGGPLLNSKHQLAGVLQGPKVFFSGVVGALLSPAALPLFNAANQAAG